MLDLDAHVDLDTPAYDLDGNPVGTTPPVTIGGGRPFTVKKPHRPKLAPFVAIRERIVGTATATFGPLEAAAHAVIVHDGHARSHIRSRIRAVAIRTVLAPAVTKSTFTADSRADRTVLAATVIRLHSPTFRSAALRTINGKASISSLPTSFADATITRTATATAHTTQRSEASAYITFDVRADEDELLLLL